MTSSARDNASAPSNQADQPAAHRTERCPAAPAQLVGTADILKGINLAIPGSQHVAVVGPSGAGKTSLLMVMSGLEVVKLWSGGADRTGHNRAE